MSKESTLSGSSVHKTQSPQKGEPCGTIPLKGAAFVFRLLVERRHFYTIRAPSLYKPCSNFDLVEIFLARGVELSFQISEMQIFGHCASPHPLNQAPFMPCDRWPGCGDMPTSVVQCYRKRPMTGQIPRLL